MFNILEGYDIVSMGFNSLEYWYFLVEVKKLVFEDCVKFYVDFVFNEILVDWLVLKEYVEECWVMINLDCVVCSYEFG